MEKLVNKVLKEAVGCLVFKGLLNGSIAMILDSELIFGRIMTKDFMRKILQALDEQTVNDIETNIISKLRQALRSLEKQNDSFENVRKKLYGSLLKEKGVKRPFAKIQNVSSICCYLRKVNEAKSNTTTPEATSRRNEVGDLAKEFIQELERRIAFSRH